MPPKNEAPKTLADELMEECSHFVSDGGYSAEDMREAYLILLEGEEREGMSESVATLLAKMKELEAKGLPLNRLARSIELKDDDELPKERYFEYVSHLPVSPKEKSILCSIVEKCRSGRLEFYHKGESFMGMQINAKNATSEKVGRDLKGALEQALARYQLEGGMSVTFEED